MLEQLRRKDATSKDGRTLEEIERRFGCRAEPAPDHLLVQGFSHVLRAPCGCYACDNGVEPGHFACEQPTGAMLKAESEGLIVRHLEDSTWRWFVV